MFRNENLFALVVSAVAIMGAMVGWSLAHAQLPPGLEGKHIQVPMICGPTHLVEKFLELDHGELPVVNVKSRTGHMASLYVDSLHQSTSVAIHRPDGQTCVLWGTKCEIGECFMPTEHMVIQ